tara:strand:- start:350 stop:928 length:579 start_codon:yes stop_codon:yes gene_type:complete
MFIQTEITPNPATLKFIPESKVLESGTMEFSSKEEAMDSDLARSIFENDAVKNVFFGEDFITVTKDSKFEWDILKPDILSKIMTFFSSNSTIINNTSHNKNIDLEEKTNYSDSEKQIVEQIKTLLEEKIKPAVAQDGGDISFVKFHNNIVYLILRGSCAGCPSSQITLKSGIENMLKYYIPEISAVEAVNDT